MVSTVFGCDPLDELAVEVVEADAVGAGDDEVEHRPAEGEAAGLAGEAADHLGAPADLDEGALEQVRGPDPVVVLGRPAQVREDRVEVVGDDGHRRRVGGPVVGDDRLEAAARVGDRAGVVEDLPPARLELAVVALGQLRAIQQAFERLVDVYVVFNQNLADGHVQSVRIVEQVRTYQSTRGERPDLATTLACGPLDELLALHDELGGPGVGALGMCFTGGYALGMMVDSTVLAPVLSQPSLPLGPGRKRKAAVGISDDDFAAVKRLLREGGAFLNHGITTSDTRNRSVGRGAGEFIGRYVFPKGELPHLHLVVRDMSDQDFEVHDVEETVARIARIPPKQVTTEDRDKLKNLEPDLKRVIFGQDVAIEQITTARLGIDLGAPLIEQPVHNVAEGRFGAVGRFDRVCRVSRVHI